MDLPSGALSLKQKLELDDEVWDLAFEKDALWIVLTNGEAISRFAFDDEGLLRKDEAFSFGDDFTAKISGFLKGK